MRTIAQTVVACSLRDAEMRGPNSSKIRNLMCAGLLGILEALACECHEEEFNGWRSYGQDSSSFVATNWAIFRSCNAELVVMCDGRSALLQRSRTTFPCLSREIGSVFQPYLRNFRRIECVSQPDLRDSRRRAIIELLIVEPQQSLVVTREDLIGQLPCDDSRITES